jgi:DNA invertase Pin-like site-specific DNA recombinase
MASKNPNHGSPPRRAVGIVRVSRVAGREGESFASPDEQRQRIEAECEREGLELLDVIPEMDVSGGTPLEKREGLRTAVERIEAGDAEVVVGAYLDRLCRSLKVQGELTDRVEAAGGKVLAVDVGQLTNGSASQWLSGTLLGAVNEYQRRTTTERTAGAQAHAVARGAQPWARVQLGYRRRDTNPKTGKPTGPLIPNPREVPIVQQAFKMRADGESITEIRKMLKSHGVERSHRGVQVMLASRIYLGEVHFGKLVNLHAHEALIDRDLWSLVQRMVIPRGRQPSSDRLLARLSVLRCGSCGARLGAMKLPKQHDYPIYRCPSTSDCDHHCTISAVIAEDVVSSAVRAALADAQGRASMAEGVQEATRALERAQADLDAGVRSFAAAGLENEAAAVERLTGLRATRDDAQLRVNQLGPQAAWTVNAATDWDKLSLTGRRELIRATVESAIVAPSGRGAERITVRLIGQ